MTDTATNTFPGVPSFTAAPPANGALQPGEVRHACMGLNHCKGQGRMRGNDCAGQGYCSTALAYNSADAEHGLVSDHQCHVTNQCKGQGGCGLYGTSDEQNAPGGNTCRSLGSCATPINAERFSTDGANRGKSVWVRARAVFTRDVWPGLDPKNGKHPTTPPAVPGATDNPDLFQYGPTIEWMDASAGMTACGASGMSGAGSCA